jgi:retron-type reverse transcriptase
LKKNARLLPFALSDDDLKVIRSLVCKSDRLTIGAPSSPAISNALLYEFDLFWWDKCRKLSVVYSRYADDLYFSTNKSKILADLLSELRNDFKKRKHPCLSLNENKTVFTSRKHKRLVTGLVLTTENKVSIGRIKKRRIKSMIYNFKKNKLTDDDASYLRGYIAFINAVEPKFVETLRHKYGSETMEAIMRKPLISKK